MSRLGGALALALAVMMIAGAGADEMVVRTVIHTEAAEPSVTEEAEPAAAPAEIDFPSNTPIPAETQSPTPTPTLSPEPSPSPTAEITSTLEPECDIIMTLIPQSETSFTNVLLHYVYFDVEVQKAERLQIRLLDPEGVSQSFRNRKMVDQKQNPIRTQKVTLKAGQESVEGLNILFPSNRAPGTWSIEVTAVSSDHQELVQTIPVKIMDPAEVSLTMLPQVHAMIDGLDGEYHDVTEPGRIRYVSQNPDSSLFVKYYWFSAAFDLRPGANQKCTRAVFSMALSWLGIDCTPIRMSELVRSSEVEYTYDRVCKKIGNVERISGTLEDLWARYMAGEASPVLLHFNFDDGMHAVLLVARDEENPDLFYAVNSGIPVNTSAHPDGMKRDVVLPLIIEKGEKGGAIQSPLLKRYHKAKIDKIWQWKKTDD